MELWFYIVNMAALVCGFFPGIFFLGVCLRGLVLLALDFIHIPDGSKIFAFNSCFPCHGYV